MLTDSTIEDKFSVIKNYWYEIITNKLFDSISLSLFVVVFFITFFGSFKNSKTVTFE